MAAGRRIVLATTGSLGDLHPFLALALALKGLGHAPLLATHEDHRAKVEAEGLAFAPLRPSTRQIQERLGLDIADVFERMSRDPDFLLRDLQMPFLSETYEDVRAAALGADMVVAHNIVFGAAPAARALGLPLVRVALAPIFMQSATDPSETGPAPYVFTPRSAAAIGWNRFVRALVRGRIAASLKPLRDLGRRLGVAHAGADAMFDCGHGDGAPVLGLYSPVFGPVQPDHPPGLTLVGFPSYDSEAGGQPALDPALAAFLDAGPAPIVFSLGSFAVHAPGDFYRASLEAARVLGRRALLLAGAEEAERLAGAGTGGGDVFVGSYAPHSLVFPRAAAIVHHGGIGTTAQALRSGRPQLVTPFLGDQHDNARRVRRLGVGRRLRPKRYERGGAAAALRTVLEDPAYAAAARGLAPVFRGEDGAMAGALHLDELLRQG